MSLFYILAALLMLGVMVTVHEAGHFFAARLTGIPVKEFAIGFGPKLFSWRSKKHETRFFLRLIPAGGYCMFYGEDDTEGKEAKEDPRSIGKFAVWRRMVTIFMGPVMNFVLAMAVAAALYAGVGEDVGGEFGYAVVQSVSENTPAAEAGMQEGDVILSINGQDAGGLAPENDQGSTGYMLSYLIDSYREGDAPLTVGIDRNGEMLEKSLIPQYSAAEGRYLLGITIGFQYTPAYAPVSVFRAVALGADYCVRAAGDILGGLRDLITTGRGLEETSGPVGIIQLIAEETRAYGWLTYAELLVMISVNLGLFNLIPIPGLDGSRLVFLLIEGVRRKPVPRKVEAYVHMSGYLILMALMIVMTYKDILKIFR